MILYLKPLRFENLLYKFEMKKEKKRKKDLLLKPIISLKPLKI